MDVRRQPVRDGNPLQWLRLFPTIRGALRTIAGPLQLVDDAGLEFIVESEEPNGLVVGRLGDVTSGERELVAVIQDHVSASAHWLPPLSSSADGRNRRQVARKRPFGLQSLAAEVRPILRGDQAARNTRCSGIPDVTNPAGDVSLALARSPSPTVFGKRSDAIRASLEHFPLVLSTRPWYFSRRGGADGRGVLNGSADARAEGLRRGAVVEGASRSVLRESRVGRRLEATAAGNRRVRAAQAHKIARSGVGVGGNGLAGCAHRV